MNVINANQSSFAMKCKLDTSGYQPIVHITGKEMRVNESVRNIDRL